MSWNVDKVPWSEQSTKASLSPNHQRWTAWLILTTVRGITKTNRTFFPTQWLQEHTCTLWGVGQILHERSTNTHRLSSKPKPTGSCNLLPDDQKPDRYNETGPLFLPSQIERLLGWAECCWLLHLRRGEMGTNLTFKTPLPHQREREKDVCEGTRKLLPLL